MAAESFPKGAAALHPDWPEARFNISGMFTQDELIMQFVCLIDRDFECRVPVETVHGAPAMPWNAGRLADDGFDPAAFDTVLGLLNSQGIGYFPTFTNHRLEAADLGNAIGNALLERIARAPRVNGVIVSSELLSRHIGTRYPALRQVASVTKVTMEGGIGRADYYRKLGERFYRYVVDPDDSRDLELMDKLDREKTEILVNENCVGNCPTRRQHYDAYAKLQKALGTSGEQAARAEIDGIDRGCRSLRRIGRAGYDERSCNLSRAEMKSLYEMGFRHFKLQGRADDPFSYAFDLVRTMLEPDFVGPRAFKMLCPWLCTVIGPRLG